MIILELLSVLSEALNVFFTGGIKQLGATGRPSGLWRAQRGQKEEEGGCASGEEQRGRVKGLRGAKGGTGVGGSRGKSSEEQRRAARNSALFARLPRAWPPGGAVEHGQGGSPGRSEGGRGGCRGGAGRLRHGGDRR